MFFWNLSFLSLVIEKVNTWKKKIRKYRETCVSNEVFPSGSLYHLPFFKETQLTAELVPLKVPKYAQCLPLWQNSLNCHFRLLKMTGIKQKTRVLCGISIEFIISIKNSNDMKANYCEFRWLFWMYLGTWQLR